MCEQQQQQQQQLGSASLWACKLHQLSCKAAINKGFNSAVEAPGWWRDLRRSTLQQILSFSFFFFFVVSHDALPSNSGLRGLLNLTTNLSFSPSLTPGYCLCSPLQKAGLRLPSGASAAAAAAASEPRISAASVTWQTIPRFGGTPN